MQRIFEDASALPCYLGPQVEAIDGQRTMDRGDLKSVWELILLVSPAPLGALIGLRYATALSKRQQASNFLCSLGLGYFSGALAGALWPTLTHNAIALLTIAMTAASMEIMAGIFALARGFAADPFSWIGKMLDLVMRVLTVLRGRAP